MSTAQEIDWGRGIAKEIVAEEGTLDDPLLTRWVKAVGGKLIGHTVRNDVPYSVTIINSEEVNAFSIPGGYIFVDAGLLNFVHSDDELAAVLAHEIGHVERRHVVTLSQKAKALEIILDVAGIFAPGVTRFGNLAGDLILFKLSRVDELQADQYGVKLMSQAGYDPEGMAAFLNRLETIHPEHKSLLGRYFETHPALRDRVAHVRGYPELDQSSAGALLAQVIRDDAAGEYFTAREKVGRVLRQEPNNALAQSYDRKLTAIFAPSERTRRVSAGPTSVERALGDFGITSSESDAAAVNERVKLANKELDEYSKYLNYLGFYVDAQSRIGIPRGSRLDRVLSAQTRISQAMDHNYDQVSETVAQIKDLADGSVKLARELRALMDRPQATTPDEAQIRVLLQRSALAHRNFVRAADAARGAMAAGWESGKVIKIFLDKFDQVANYKGGDMKAPDYYGLQPSLRKALAAAKQAAKAADVAARLLNDGESMELMDRIDMTAPQATSPRAESFAALLLKRFGAGIPSRRVLGTSSPAETAAAAIISAEDGRSFADTLLALQKDGSTPTDYAAAMHVRAETLQLELGLVWLAYTDGRL